MLLYTAASTCVYCVYHRSKLSRSMNRSESGPAYQCNEERKSTGFTVTGKRTYHCTKDRNVCNKPLLYRADDRHAGDPRS